MLNISGIIGKFIKNSSQREIDRLKSIVQKINELESKIKDLPDKSFPAKTLDLNSSVLAGKLSLGKSLIFDSNSLIFWTFNFNLSISL